MTSMIGVEEALAIVRAAATPLATETIGLAQSLGRVLASAQDSRVDLPAFDNAAMDGFALRAPQGIAAGAEFDVSGEQAAGDGARTAGDGAWEIMTGARMPDGFDTVVPVEDVQVLTRDAAHKPMRIRLTAEANAAQHVRLRGSDIARGDRAVEAGVCIGPAERMLLGGTGADRILVRRRPRVALLCTGRELIDVPGQTLTPGQIYNTNGPYLSAHLTRAGAEVVVEATIPDEPDTFADAVRAALDHGVDLIVSTGAVSMGRYDFVPDTLRALGGEVLFHKLRMRPGKPLLLARMPAGPLCFGLPGNPVSSAVGARFFVEAALRTMLGMPSESPWRLPLATAVRKKPGFDFFQKAALSFDRDGRVAVQVLPGQESFRTRPLLDATVWARLAAQDEWLAAGSLVDIHPLCHLDHSLMRALSP